jgi:hypothetical protein
MELIYFGRDIYYKSFGMVSAVYSKDGRRFEWEDVERFLAENDEPIVIRKATEIEMEYIKDAGTVAMRFTKRHVQRMANRQGSRHIRLPHGFET